MPSRFSCLWIFLKKCEFVSLLFSHLHFSAFYVSPFVYCIFVFYSKEKNPLRMANREQRNFSLIVRIKQNSVSYLLGEERRKKRDWNYVGIKKVARMIHPYFHTMIKWFCFIFFRSWSQAFIWACLRKKWKDFFICVRHFNNVRVVCVSVSVSVRWNPFGKDKIQNSSTKKKCEILERVKWWWRLGDVVSRFASYILK